ncbi:MAG TPA: pyridoxal phosphate-dependent aminotransferase [Gemmatimonadaceae bacterium]|nr:pyridoxal phosphate-dependent aminotransferase [Gemmatimonadaceae bacterium]
MSARYSPSVNVADLEESATIAVSARAKALRAAGRAVIDLGAGEPDFSTPSFIRESAKRAIDGGATRYTLVEGILPLRQVIAERANERLGEDVISPTDVVVSTGSKQSLFNSCFVLFGSGDEVLVPTPAWTSYYQMLTLARARPVVVRGRRENSLKITPHDLEQAATPRTRGVMLNSPTNPTGAVYSLDELRAILSLAALRGWWVVSDEIYREISHDWPAASLLDAARGESVLRERLVVVDGVAKAYAMTGWRIGWSIAPREVARAMCALQSHTTSNTSTISQHAALCALSSRDQSQAAIATMVAEFRRRRDAATELLHAAGVDFIEPKGAFYLFIRVPERENDPEAGSTFARELLDSHDVAVVPGAAFRTPDWIRMSYAAPMEDVLEGVRRVISALASRGK